MAFLVSPGVQVKEIDLTNVIPATSASIGALAGSFQWGPVDEVITVGSEKQLVNIFGQPNDDTFQYFMAGQQFLSYGNTLRVVRQVGALAVNATDEASPPTLIKNDGHADTITGVKIAARFAGVIGNSIAVDICPASSTSFDAWSFKDNFNGAPGTSSSASAVGGSNDEMHIVVYDYTGAITGAVGTILETYEYVSQASDAYSSDGTSNYYANVLNTQSAWVRSLGHATELSSLGATASTAFETVAGSCDIAAGANNENNCVASGGIWDATGTGTVFQTELSDGVDDNQLTVGELSLAFDHFADAETVEISLLMNGNPFAGSDATTISNKIIGIADARKDCVAFVSPPITATVNNANAATDVITWADSVMHTSYAFADSSALYVYDKYNDTYRWIAASGAMAGLSANADMVADAWFSPAGFNRGNIKNVTKLAFNPTQSNRDDLYKRSVNPLVSFPGQGTVLYGDKTLQSKPSAFDRINVRRLFITLEKAISRASKASLFEFNDEFTRAQFRNMTEPFLRDIKGRRGITDFMVVCDDTNNTGDVIDTNRFVADIYIKPARSINFITLNFIATRTGVEFSEIAGGK